MRLTDDDSLHLTYCTNIHPANGWPHVLDCLSDIAPALKKQVSPDRPLGLGLRLSGDESRELLRGNALAEFADFLADHDLYVALINGFPYGPFHAIPVKDDVHKPDWLDPERPAYTLRLARILSHLLPEHLDGGISTNPLSYRMWVDREDPQTRARFADHLIKVAASLARIRAETGKLIHLDIEPEPDGVIENTGEVIDFFEQCLFGTGAGALSRILGCTADTAREHIRDHVRICLDTCHVAVVYEDIPSAVQRLTQAGIRIGRMQLSSALRAEFPEGDPTARATRRAALEPFAESVYLHQVVQRNRDQSFTRFPDLADALAAGDDPAAAEWRIHFHVPLFVETYQHFDSTQPELRDALDALKATPFTRHAEIETYTWDVLPPDLKSGLVDSIAREFRWVIDRLA